MGIYLNPGNDEFYKAINSKIYVDMTYMIDFTNSLLDTEHQNICVSRPRRFGKSICRCISLYRFGCFGNN